MWHLWKFLEIFLSLEKVTYVIADVCERILYNLYVMLPADGI